MSSMTLSTFSLRDLVVMVPVLLHDTTLSLAVMMHLAWATYNNIIVHGKNVHDNMSVLRDAMGPLFEGFTTHARELFTQNLTFI